MSTSCRPPTLVETNPPQHLKQDSTSCILLRPVMVLVAGVVLIIFGSLCTARVLSGGVGLGVPLIVTGCLMLSTTITAIACFALFSLGILFLGLKLFDNY